MHKGPIQPLPFRAPEGASRRERFGSHSWSDEARRALETDLRSAVKGEVRFDGGTRAMYSAGGSNYRQVPIGVVIPKDIDDVLEAVRIARLHRAPILGRGGGTSLAGQCCNVALVIDCSKYFNTIVELDPGAGRARVEPGLILDHLRKAAGKHKLTFAPDPSTHNHCTLGGMIGNNSCGVHSLMAGKTDENVYELDILLYDGTRMTVGRTDDPMFERIVREGGRRAEIYQRLRAFRDKYADEIRRRYPPIPRRVSGYNLPALLPENGFDVARALVGSESTCVMVLGATVRLVPNPQYKTLVALAYPDVYRAADDVTRVLEFKPIGLEGMDDRLIEDIRHIGVRSDSLAQLPKGGGWLLVEFGGDSREESDAKANAMVAELAKSGNEPKCRVFDDRSHEEEIWKTREAGLGATAHVTSEHPTWEGWEDSSVPPERLGQYLRGLRALLNRYDYIGDFYGHFGQGCLHTRINFDLLTAPGIRKFRSFIEEAADLVVSHGGSLSGEHGDGQSRAELLPKMFGEELVRAFGEFKTIWDPDGLMNPGKLVDPYRIDENLRFGADYDHEHVRTYFSFEEEHGHFPRAVTRCVGVGECRRVDTGTMCPSFQVTREEKHSTRGRAHLLWEMLEGDPLEGGWQSQEVREALDLCLACKGCKGECPVHVDMATYKAEFLAHYYEKHWRPRTAWAFGLIHWWARLASLAPSFVNAVTQAPGLSAIAKLFSGMPQQRRVPAFAAYTFKNWYQNRTSILESRSSTDSVLLWPDTFNNHFHPEAAIAATELLESGGFNVIVPERDVCCGRPLYDYGLLPLARRTLLNLLEVMREPIRAGVPVVVLEPSCASVLRDEMVNLLPGNDDAKRLRQQVVLLADFVRKHRDRFDLPKFEREVLFHGHCHQKALFDTRGDVDLLKSMGARVNAPNSGCCGMAGSFGFEESHYEVSEKIGERVLLPEVRKADRRALIVADGFSCREQVAQLTGRRAVHLAQALRLAQQEKGKNRDELPEQRVAIDHARETAERLPAYAAVALVALGAGLALMGYFTKSISR
jgi:FAD/FMN-containing dehydrogenase/Fe-S oxidoreductase